jgi:hypothetical protein
MILQKVSQNILGHDIAKSIPKYPRPWQFSIFYHDQSMDAKKSSKANKIRANFFETNTLIFYTL